MLFFSPLTLAQSSATKCGRLPARRWPQYEITFRVRSLCLRRFSGARLEEELVTLSVRPLAFCLEGPMLERVFSFCARRDFLLTFSAMALPFFSNFTLAQKIVFVAGSVHRCFFVADVRVWGKPGLKFVHGTSAGKTQR